MFKKGGTELFDEIKTGELMSQRTSYDSCRTFGSNFVSGREIGSLIGRKKLDFVFIGWRIKVHLSTDKDKLKD